MYIIIIDYPTFDGTPRRFECLRTASFETAKQRFKDALRSANARQLKLTAGYKPFGDAIFKEINAAKRFKECGYAFFSAEPESIGITDGITEPINAPIITARLLYIDIDAFTAMACVINNLSKRMLDTLSGRDRRTMQSALTDCQFSVPTKLLDYQCNTWQTFDDQADPNFEGMTGTPADAGIPPERVVLPDGTPRYVSPSPARRTGHQSIIREMERAVLLEATPIMTGDDPLPIRSYPSARTGGLWPPLNAMLMPDRVNNEVGFDWIEPIMGLVAEPTPMPAAWNETAPVPTTTTTGTEPSMPF